MESQPSGVDADAAGRAVLVATLAVVLAAFCWGLNAVIAKGAFEAGIAPARFATALAWLLLSQSLGIPQLPGGVLVVGGVVLAQFAQR